MTKKEMETQRKDLADERKRMEKVFYNFATSVNPCDLCRHYNYEAARRDECCHECCYYYPSEFEMGEIKNDKQK